VGDRRLSFTWDVLGLGAVAVDDLVYVDGHPAPDTKAPIVEELREAGGLAGTALVTVARLGGCAAYLGVLGDDELSRFTISELEGAGVDCALVERRTGARPIHSVIIVDRASGQRTLLYSLAGVVPPDPARITDDIVGRARVLFVDSTVIQVALRAAELAHRAGVPVVADLEDADADGVRDLAQTVDHLIVGTDFASRLTGESSPERMVRALWRPGSSACVVTAGDRGCWYVAPGTRGVAHEPARQVTAVDTNGCGDVFHGAYAACIARGERVERAVAVATIAAAGKATTRGGRRGIPDWETVQRLLVDPRADDEITPGVIGRSESARMSGGPQA
jgi:sulfofructose kinase